MRCIASTTARIASSDWPELVHGARLAIASLFLTGKGIEVGAGNRPFPVPDDIYVNYGDVRDKKSLDQYFKADIAEQIHIDAQSFMGIELESQDFIISAHVIEHLEDPVGSIVNAMRALRRGGIYILVVPDMRHTFDKDRPETTVEHVAADFADGGKSTRLQAYLEHVRHVHPLFRPVIPAGAIMTEAQKIAAAHMDVHFHAWTRCGFHKLLYFAAMHAPFQIISAVSVANENIFVLKKSLR